MRRIHDMEELAPSPSSDAFAVSSPASFRGRPTIGRPRTRPSERHFHAPHMKGCTTSFAPNSHRGRRRSDGPRRPCRAPLNLPGSSRCWRQARRPSMRPGGARPRPVGACLQSLQPPFIIKEVDLRAPSVRRVLQLLVSMERPSSGAAHLLSVDH